MATINATNGSSLDLNYDNFATEYGSGAPPQDVALNVSGTVSLNALISYSTFNTTGGRIHFIGDSTLGPYCFGTINSNIYGPATLHLTGGNAAGVGLTLGGDVGQRVTIALDTQIPVATLTITHPNRFFGLIQLANSYNPPPYGFGDVVLSGLSATSARLSGGHLDLFNGNKRVGDIRIAGDTANLGAFLDKSGVILAQGPYGSDPAIPLAHS